MTVAALLAVLGALTTTNRAQDGIALCHGAAQRVMMMVLHRVLL